MEVFNYPEVSIITVNFNGKRFLTRLFNSIKELDYPADRIQTIFVDNYSKDGSVELVRGKFPWVEVISLDKNYGYAGGNNAGLHVADGDYVALINNDCVVDREWLVKMVEVAVQKGDNEKTGAVCSRVLFYHDYIPVRFEFENGSGRLYISINNITVDGSPETNNGLLQYVKIIGGFPSIVVSNYVEGLTLPAGPGALLALPVPEFNSFMSTGFLFSAEESTVLKIFLEHPANPGEPSGQRGPELFSGNIEAGKQALNLRIDRDGLDFKGSLINSCGLEVNRAFYARDRGSNKWDKDLFRDVEEVFSPSGSSLLINRKMLDETGYFDDSFFTYYEDVDLFWRARLMGWKHYFSPFSIARHHHCGTGREWSYSFSYHVIRNRLLAIFKCGWFLKFAGCYFSFFLSVFSNAFLYILALSRGKKQARPDVRARIRIFFELFYLLPKNLGKRIKIRKNSSEADKEIMRWMVDF